MMMEKVIFLKLTYFIIIHSIDQEDIEQLIQKCDLIIKKTYEILDKKFGRSCASQNLLRKHLILKIIY